MGLHLKISDENDKEIDSFKPADRQYWIDLISELETDVVCKCEPVTKFFRMCECFEYAPYKIPKEMEIQNDLINEIRKGHEFVYIRVSF